MDAIMTRLPEVEAMCQQLYLAQSPEQRTQAEQALAPFGRSTEYIPHCKALLDNSRSPYAQLLASSSLTKLVTEHSLSPNVRMEMKAYFLAYLDQHGSSLQDYVLSSLVQLLCRTVKLAWFDSESAKVIVDECKAFMEKGTPGHYMLGLKVLHMLVTEMNTATPGRTLTQHRKVSVSFRDLALLNVFKVSLVALRYLLDNAADDKLKHEGLQLALACLSFDFVGTCLDDSAEDLTTIQVPSAWRGLIEDASTVQLFQDYYSSSSPPNSSTSLECLVRLASVRRSLFSSEAERAKFLNRLVNATREILCNHVGLREHNNYHECCRLLGRLKTNYQLAELVAVDNYVDWIEQVALLTIQSLNAWQWAQGSVFYLLGLWSRLVSSTPYLKGDAPSLLDVSVPKIIKAYIESRLQSVQMSLQDGSLEELLESEEQLSEQLDSMPYLCRFQYQSSSELICSILDPLVNDYTKAAQLGVSMAASPDLLHQLAILEGQLAWMVSIVGAVLRGKLTSSSTESQDAIDGELAARVLALLQLMDSGYHQQRYGQRTRQRLDQSVLGFFQNFQKVYIGEQVMHSSFVYSKLGERLPGVTDHNGVLQLMLSKIAINLQKYGESEPLVHATLSLFQDLAQGYMSGKLLMKLDAVALMLGQHSSQHFKFLDHPVNSRNRTVYYSTLARLLFMEDTPSRFKTFVAPLQQTLFQLGQASHSPTMRQLVPQETVIGLFRDLRGIASATATRRTYCLLFDWLYPAHFATLLACLHHWADVPAVTVPLLKFMSEFAFNKSQRITFDSSSPNGILLFREVSKVLVTYGRHILATAPNGNSGSSGPAAATAGGGGGGGSAPYSRRYKGIWVCLQLLSRGMSGNYVNFGVFELYNDPALKDALDVALRCALSIPLNDIIGYKKVSKAYFALLDVLCNHHTGTIAQQDDRTFTFILNSLDMGLKSLDVVISSACASAVDNLAGFYFKNAVQGPESSTPAAGTQALQEHIRNHPTLLPEILKTLFEIILFEECSNQWSLSRPMLSLILINEPIYEQLKQQIIAQQPSDRQQHLAACLGKLMVDVQRNLEPKNRDKYTQNLTVVRHEYRSKV